MKLLCTQIILSWLTVSATKSPPSQSGKTLGANVADDKTTIDRLTKHRKKEWH
jgi:hypothetical protein